MEYICRKACTFGSRKYHTGDHIPDGVVLPRRERALVAMGYITPAPPPAEPIKAAGRQQEPVESVEDQQPEPVEAAEQEEKAPKKKKGEAGA